MNIEIRCSDVPLFVCDSKSYRQLLRQNKTYMSATGPIDVERCHNRSEGQYLCPLGATTNNTFKFSCALWGTS